MGVRSTSRVYFIVSRLVYGGTSSMCFHTLRITSVDRPEKFGWRGASLSPSVRQAALSQCETFTDTVQLNVSLMQLTKAEQKEAAGSAWRLFQNHRLPDKTSRDILLDIWKCLPCLKIVTCLLHDFSRSLGWATLVYTRRLFRQQCTSWVLDICGATVFEHT